MQSVHSAHVEERRSIASLSWHTHHDFETFMDFIYSFKCSAFYDPGSEGGILWSDSAIGIDWPLDNYLLSDKDLKYSCLKDVPAERLPFMEVDSCRSLQPEQTGRLAGS